jgi:exodeoxyribonuclease X
MKPYIFDTETTGTDHEKDQIIEAAWLELPGKPCEFANSIRTELPNYCERFRPSVPISLGAQAVHHILTADLKDCRPSADFALPNDVDILIGHNVDFDARFADAMHLRRICTLALSRFLFPDKDSHTQSAMIYMMGRRSSMEEAAREALRNAHAALDDVHNCAGLLLFLLSAAMDKGHPCDTWEEVHALSEIARIPTVMGFGKHKGTKIARGQLDAGYVRWYRGQAETDPYYLEAFKRAGF